MATATTSGQATSDEHWVALNKNMFVDILNEILSQSLIPTPEMTSRAPGEDGSPTYVCVGDDVSVSRRNSSVNWNTLLSDADTSSFPCCNADIMMSPFAGCPQSKECDQIEVNAATSEWNVVEGKSQSTSSLPFQRLSPDMVSVVGDDSASADIATDLTTVDRQQPQSRCSAEVCRSSISSSHQSADAAADACHSSLDWSKWQQSVDDVYVQSPEQDSTSTGGSDFTATTRDLAVSRRAPCVDTIRDDLEQESSTSSSTLSPDYVSTASPAGVSQSLISCHPAASGTLGDGTKAEVGPRGSWMAIDKTLLCDVVDQMLYEDKIFGYRERDDCTFPFPVDSYSTGSICASRSHSPEMMTPSALQRFCDGDFIMHNLLRPISPVQELETPQQSQMTSSLYLHRGGSSRKCDRLKKRSKYAAPNFTSGKRLCCDSDCRNVLPFPVYVQTRNDNMNCSDDDDSKTQENMAHSPSLKWKSTMLLRMRTETLPEVGVQ